MNKPAKQPPILSYRRERLFVTALPFTHHNLTQCLEFASPHVDSHNERFILFKKLPYRTRHQHAARVGQVIIRDGERMFAKNPDWFSKHFRKVENPVPELTPTVTPPPAPKPANEPPVGSLPPGVVRFTPNPNYKPKKFNP